jgi:hypothetical protein
MKISVDVKLHYVLKITIIIIIIIIIIITYLLRGLSPRANYTDRATAACWLS